MKRIIGLLAWLACAPAAIADIDVVVELPPQVDWIQANNVSDDDNALREWVPSGKTVENTDWLIVEQKLKPEKKTSARKFIRWMHRLFRDACTNVKINGPKRVDSAKRKTYWSQVICAKQLDKPYGTVSMQRVIAEGDIVLVVTSELRTSPSEVAGTFAFDSPEDASNLWNKIRQSSEFVLESVHVLER